MGLAGRRIDEEGLTGTAMHLAELNIAKARYLLDDPRIAGFVERLDAVNAVAERSEGFVWRLKDEAGNALAIQAFDDPDLIVNMSVWETPDHLEHFVWNTVHKQVYRRKAEWFDALASHHFVMWWVEEGHEPTLAEAREKLEKLDRDGDSDEAFGWAHLPHVKLWQSQRCA